MHQTEDATPQARSQHQSNSTPPLPDRPIYRVLALMPRTSTLSYLGNAARVKTGFAVTPSACHPVILLQLATRQAYEHVLQTCVPGRQTGQGLLCALQPIQQRGQGDVRSRNSQVVRLLMPANAAHVRQAAERVFIQLRPVVHGELDEMGS